jgi:hypothetical protein
MVMFDYGCDGTFDCSPLYVFLIKCVTVAVMEWLTVSQNMVKLCV